MCNYGADFMQRHPMTALEVPPIGRAAETESQARLRCGAGDLHHNRTAMLMITPPWSVALMRALVNRLP